MNTIKPIFHIFSIFLLLSCTPRQDKPCNNFTRIAVDMGSGSTRVKGALLDCKGVILKTIGADDFRRKLSFKDSLKKSLLDQDPANDNRFPPTLISKARQDLKIMIQQMKQLMQKEKYPKPQTYLVATAAFRAATEGEKALQEIASPTVDYFKVLSQTEEAQLGYQSALYHFQGQKEKPHLVWDIGGGSMQLVHMLGEQPHIYQGTLAAEQAKNLFLKIQNRTKSHSPNPILPEHTEQFFQKIKNETSKSKLDLKLHAKDIKVIGIGSVHYYSIAGQTGKLTFTAEDVKRAFEKRLKLSDQELIQLNYPDPKDKNKTKYIDTDLSNLILVYGYMRELGIKEVTALKANLTEGLLVKPETVFAPR